MNGGGCDDRGGPDNRGGCDESPPVNATGKRQLFDEEAQGNYHDEVKQSSGSGARGVERETKRTKCSEGPE